MGRPPKNPDNNAIKDSLAPSNGNVALINNIPIPIELNGLPDKPTYRVDEVARYFDVEDRTIRLWIEHGKLGALRIAGTTLRIPKEAILQCTIKTGKQVEAL